MRLMAEADVRVGLQLLCSSSPPALDKTSTKTISRSCFKTYSNNRMAIASSSQAGPSSRAMNGRAASNGRVRSSRSRNGHASSSGEEEEDGEENATQSAKPTQSQTQNARLTQGRASGASQMTQSMRYDPHGDAQKKRQLRRDYRRLLDTTKEARNNLAETRPEDLRNVLRETGTLFENVDAPSEGILDSRLLLSASDLAAAMANGMKVGTTFDMDEYLVRVARLIGGRLGAANELDNVVDDDDTYGELQDPAYWRWERLGRRAVKRSRRAVTMGHLLGPLEVEHNKRNVRARAVQDEHTGPVRPKNLRQEDIVDTSNETSKLVMHVLNALEKHGGQQGVNFFKFVIDPDSFSNSVENMFYVSFLIREGKASLDTETENGEPMLMSCEQPNEEDYEQGVKRRQIVMELDVQVWKELTRIYDIRTPMIESRRQTENAQTDTWARAS